MKRRIWILATALGACLSSGVLAEETTESRFMPTPRQLIYEGRRSGEGYFSPDGKTLVFQSEREPGNPFFQIYTLDLETGDSIRISPGHGKTTCAFIRANTGEVLFASTHLDPKARQQQQEELRRRESGKEKRYSWDYDETFDLFCAEKDGSRPRRLTNARGYDAEGSYSPDGKWVVFSSNRQAYPKSQLNEKERKLLEVDPAYFAEIYIMGASGGTPTRLTNWPGYDGGPFFSPDGERIIWRHFEENGAIADIYTMKLDGTEKKKLTEFESMSWAPYFHPSGDYVIFASNKFGFSNFELFIVDSAGKHEPVRVTQTDRFDGLPVFSPDGNTLCWTTNRTGASAQLFLTRWNHDEAKNALAESPLNPAPLVANETPHRKRSVETVKNPGPPATDTITRASKYMPEIRADELKEMVTYLASDELEGRMTGSEGTRKASEAIASLFQDIGLLPLGDNGTYFHEFEFTSGVESVPSANTLDLIKDEHTSTFVLDKDFRPLAFSTNGIVGSEVVFAGYGIVTPEGAGFHYDSYADLDVKDKIVLVLRYVPEGLDKEKRQRLNVYSGMRYKAMVARERGAAAILVVTGPNSPNAGELAPLTFDTSLAGSGIVAASVSRQIADKVLASSGNEIQKLQDALDTKEDPKSSGFHIEGLQLNLNITLNRKKGKDRNVIGFLPPNERGKELPEVIFLGAHYDHIGRGDTGGSLARKGEVGMVHNGADDNASGTALVLELACKLAHLHRRGEALFPRGIAFALWSGEEIGIIGSSAYTKDPTLPLDHVGAYLNFDMVGRLRDNKLIIQGTGSSGEWRRHLERRNVLAGFQLMLSDDPYAPTDITAFYPQGVPSLTFFTGSHEDYNRPTDDAETLNYAGMERIGKFAFNLIGDIARREASLPYVKVESKRPAGGGARENLRAYLGTIPDYAADEVPGVKLSGVGGGGPADEAGLRSGDVITKFDGQTITNIYDYTYALDAAKVNEPIEIEALRDGKKMTFTIIPRARK